MKNQKLRVDNLKHGYLFLIVLIFFTIEFFTERYDIVMDILEIMKERHSVRQYKNQAIEPSKREEISSLIMMSMRRVDYPFRLFRRTEMF